jgi:broad specificity phosphatase PhoE
VTTIFLVRHGQASFGGPDYDRLSPLGHRQSLLLGEHWRRLGLSPDAMYSGEMSRQRDTALRVVEGLTATHELQIHPGFNEYDFINVVRAYLPAVAREHPEIALDSRKLFANARAFQHAFEKCIALWVRDHAYSGAPMETWKAFCTRCLDGIRAAAPAGRGTVMIATSGGVIAAALREALGLSDDMAFALNWRIHNASVHRFKLGRRGLSLLGFNDVGHLELGGDPALLTFR